MGDEFTLLSARMLSRKRGVQNYVRAHGAPEAVFCHSDDVALGIYRGLCDLRLRVPDDVALVSTA